MEKTKISNRTIQGRLFESFEKFGDNIAIECESSALTYADLDRYSNEIANWLMGRGIKKGSFIAILVDDKIALVTVILGIIKAGCVFVPLDSRYPEKRTEAMLCSSEAPYVFVESDKHKTLKAIRRRLTFHLDIFKLDGGFYLPGRFLGLEADGDEYRLSEAEKTRYSRQLLMDGWGMEGQERLKAATVFVAGAGGSGSPLIEQLALCGFGTIIICDFDTVELSNLNRQSLHDETRIGMNKALSAKLTVERMNPNIRVIAREEKITAENVFELVGDAEILFDNVDSLEAKSCLSECAVAKGIPHTISSMIHINAYACIFHTPHTPCFHCLYDKNKIEDINKAKAMTEFYEVIPNSVASPALYMSTGFVVNEAVKILLGMGEPAYNRYFHFNQYGSPDVIDTNGYNQITYPFSGHFRELSRSQGFDWDEGWHGNYLEEIVIEPDPNCLVCSKTKVFAPLFSKSGPPEALKELDYLPEDKINIYFTSGTTGMPKSVLGKNEGMTHFIAWEIKEFGIGVGARVSQLTSQCHDPYLRDIFVPLCAGGTICVPGSRETILDSGRMKRWLEESGVQLVHCTPGLFKIINSETLTGESYPDLEHVLLAGERIVPGDLENWYRVLGGRIQLVNVYGPTETTLAKLFYLIKPDDIKRETIPIGKAIPGSKVIILDKEKNICGPGEVGEIYIRTPFRSYGYYDDPDVTAERFIQNPFSDKTGDIVYKTGDLGKVNRDGDVEFVGREDRQIKIRGFRVELDEVEKRIRDYPGVLEAVVLDRRTATGNYILCAYFRGDITVVQLKEHLMAELPDYMVPSFYIKMETFPLNVNGKINYKALPRPDEVERDEYAAPQSEMEKRMVGIWTAVLGIEKIGMGDGFLDMGGNSLNAMNLTSRVYKAFDVNLQLSDIFKNPTVRELVSLIEVSGKSIYQSITPVEERAYYPLSSSQMRMYLLREFAGEGDIGYNQTKPLHIKGRLDKERLEGAFKGLIARHEALRTGFEILDGRPVQRIFDKVDFEIELFDSAIGDFIRPFDLSIAPLLRVGLIKRAEDEFVLIFDIHHIISDGVTTGIFIEEMMKLYDGEQPAELGLQYKDYAVWQQEMLRSEPLKQQEGYWLEVFKEAPPVLNLTTDFPRPPARSYEGSHLDFDVDPGLIERLEGLARERKATLYMVLLAAYTALLYRYTGQEDIVVGSPIAGRSHEEVRKIPGVFINTLAMRNFPSGEKTVDQLLSEVTETAFKAYENQDYPFEELVGGLNLRRDLERNPLFETLFIMQNIDMKPIVLEGLEVTAYAFDVPTSTFDISLNALETPGGLMFSFEYRTRLFRRETVERFSGHFVALLEAMVTAPGLPLGRIEFLSPVERNRLVRELNDTAGEYPGDKTIHELFEEQVRRTPDAVAVNGSDRTYKTNMTYTALKHRSDGLAWLLREKGLKPGDIAALMVARSVDMLAAILAILKTGAAYLPIDPAYPRDRIDYMLKDSSACLFLTEESDLFRTSGCREQACLFQSPTNPAYVIYTSGSTGRPKGVVVSHRNVGNFITGMAKEIDFSPGKTILALTTISFDIFVLETLLPLTRGLTVVMADETFQRDGYLLGRLIENQRIDMLQVTPSRLKLLLLERTNRDCLQGLSELIVGGEAFPPDLYEAVKKEYRGKLYNVYGPTETTVWSTIKDLTGAGEAITIGKPILNTDVFILDRDDNLLPEGAAGELNIGGEGVVPGYLNRPDLTAERFCRSAAPPLTPPLYRTGDLARWLPGGDIQFLGRIDHQIKIRGFRIETGEIESRLLEHKEIKEAVVTVPALRGETTLCAYIVPREPGSSLPVDIREFLSSALPDYMIPSYFVLLADIPLTPNGKIDRGALPAPENAPRDRQTAAPGNAVEIKLAQIWSDVLDSGAGAVGIDDNFFEMGGHSLKATLLLSKIHEVFNVRIPMPAFFKIPTIRGLSTYIKNAEHEAFVSIEPTEQKEYYPLSFHQKRLWIIRRLEETNLSYNMPVRIELNHTLDTDAVKRSLYELTERHQGLRTAFKEIHGTAYQFIEKSVELPFETIDISGLRPEEKESERDRIYKTTASAIFDFARAPLFRAVMVKRENARADLVMNIHHIISDGWSMGILEREFTRLYEKNRTGKTVEMSPVPLQYKDFTQWETNRINDPALKEETRRFWLKKLEGGLPALQLPVDSNAGRSAATGGVYLCRVPGEVKKNLNRLAGTNNTTLSMVMFSIYNILLAHISNREEVACSLISAGRDHPSLHPVVGYFTNSIVIKTHVTLEDDFFELLHRVHADVLETLQYQDYPLELVLDELNIPFPEVTVSFNMLNLPGIETSAPTEGGEPLPRHMEKKQGVKFDLALFVTDYRDSIELQWHYRKSLFEPGTIESITNVYLDFLTELSED